MANKEHSILRGAKWYRQRDNEGRLPFTPTPNQQLDIDNYLDSIKKVKAEVKKPEVK